MDWFAPLSVIPLGLLINALLAASFERPLRQVVVFGLVAPPIVMLGGRGLMTLAAVLVLAALLGALPDGHDRAGMR